MDQKPVAAIIRENEFLRDVAEKAIKLRRLGMALDDFEEAHEALIKETCGVMSRSGTARMMYESAFKTAMDDFDHAVLKAAEAHMDWAGRAALGRSEG
ncbi:hypothetical protein O9X81_05450 [Agrobacterium salinitolerans]|uniref:hypothetical protein n=1 Tax=Agrobacterium salinitolerans TaxID=1183413 RepID=UPI0022B84A3D|nr:hypothetical protein [Agrobacterium salinitolerans]MCZ7856052.1 hypothetical protein [Agrobacterium salinitolerans]